MRSLPAGIQPLDTPGARRPGAAPRLTAPPVGESAPDPLHPGPGAMPEPTLSTWFLDALPAGRRPAPSAALERALGQVVAAARAAHPELSSVTDEALARHLASCAGGPEELEPLQAADVLLALACA